MRFSFGHELKHLAQRGNPLSVTVFEAKMLIGVAGPLGIGWILFA